MPDRSSSSSSSRNDQYATGAPPPSPAAHPHAAYRRAASHLLSRLDDDPSSPPKTQPQPPVIGVICGSGLSGLSSTLEPPTLSIPYSEIPGLPSECTVAGHSNEIVFGTLAGVPCVCFRGRFHHYEGHDMDAVALPVRIMRCLGVRLVFVTNAAGGLNPDYEVGDVVCMMDHIALPMLAGRNPLVGPNDHELGPRFPPTSDAYSEELQELVMDSAGRLDLKDVVRRDGTYCYVSGPMYESKSECRFLRSIGGDAVGMSTVPEIVAAHHSGMKVLCLSVITNKVIMTGDEGRPAASHDEVLEAVAAGSGRVQRLLVDVIENATTWKKQMGTTSSYLDTLPDLPPVDLSKFDGDEEEGGQQRRKDRDGCCRVPLHCIGMGAAMIALGAAFAVGLSRVGSRN